MDDVKNETPIQPQNELLRRVMEKLGAEESAQLGFPIIAENEDDPMALTQIASMAAGLNIEPDGLDDDLKRALAQAYSDKRDAYGYGVPEWVHSTPVRPHEKPPIVKVQGPGRVCSHIHHFLDFLFVEKVYRIASAIASKHDPERKTPLVLWGNSPFLYDKAGKVEVHAYPHAIMFDVLPTAEEMARGVADLIAVKVSHLPKDANLFFMMCTTMKLNTYSNGRGLSYALAVGMSDVYSESDHKCLRAAIRTTFH